MSLWLPTRPQVLMLLPRHSWGLVAQTKDYLGALGFSGFWEGQYHIWVKSWLTLESVLDPGSALPLALGT